MRFAFWAIIYAAILTTFTNCSDPNADQLTYFFTAEVEAGPVSLTDPFADWGIGANGNSVECNIGDAPTNGAEIEISLVMPTDFDASDIEGLEGDTLTYDPMVFPHIFVRYFINGGTETESSQDIEQVNSFFHIESIEETDLPASYLDSFTPARAFNVRGTMQFQTDLFTFTGGEYLLRWVVEE